MDISRRILPSVPVRTRLLELKIEFAHLRTTAGKNPLTRIATLSQNRANRSNFGKNDNLVRSSSEVASTLKWGPPWSRPLKGSIWPKLAILPRNSNLIRPRLELLEPRLYLSGTGLTGQYFFNDNFTGLADTRTEAVAYNWGAGSPGAGIDADTFSVRWIGQVQPQFTERYTFTAVSDEGVRVWVNGQLVVDDWMPHTARNAAGSIDLVADQLYDIRVDYREWTGSARMELNWSSASQAYQLIPRDRLYPSPSGLLGSYSDSSGGTRQQVDPTIDFNWGLGAPTGLTADHFQATWTGRLQADYSELYNFATRSDDGVRLWIGGELVIDNWTNHTATVDLGSKWLEAGKWYDFKVEYFDNTSTAQMELRWSSVRQTGAGVYETIPTANLQAMQETPVTFSNPLGAGADPYVVRWNGMYYLVRSSGGAVWIDRAASLDNIHNSTPESDSVKVWTPPAGTGYSKQIWAPELHFFNGKWYIYVAASDGNNDTHRMQVLERNGTDPFGAFTYKGQIAAATDRWAIDGTAFEWQGSMYFVWSGWPSATNGQQNLYIAQMDTPWSLGTDRVLLSTPTYSWEKYGLAINEGPEALIEGSTLNIIYSASGYWTNQYSLGRLTYNGVGPILSAVSWTKASQPVFKATSEVTGVGHASFTKSPDGSENWIVYHAHADPTTFNDDRVIRIQPFTFNANGTPNFGQPVPPGQLLTVPSVGPDPERPIVAGDYQADGTANNLDYNLWRATFGSAVFPGVAADGNASGTTDAGDYVLWRKATSPASGQLVTTLASTAVTQSSSDSAPQVDKYQERSLTLTSPQVVPAKSTRAAVAPHSVRLYTNERHHDDALLVLLSQHPRETRPQFEFDGANPAADQLDVGDSSAWHNACDAILTSLLM
jgi:GH43 family beta-xylosidase